MSDKANTNEKITSISMDDYSSVNKISAITIYFKEGTKNEDEVADKFVNMLIFRNNLFRYLSDAQTALCEQNGGKWPDKMFECLECR